MRFLLLVSACLIVAQEARAQDAGKWRFGVAATAPTKLLDVNAVQSVQVADSNDDHVKLKLGYGVDLARVWPLKNGAAVSLRAAVTTASVEATSGGVSWSPGRALILDLTARAERRISARTALFAGAGVSHWSGPDQTAPFTGIGTAQLGVEGGLSVRPGEGPIRIDFTANFTRFGANDAQDIATGFVWRWILEVRHGR